MNKGMLSTLNNKSRPYINGHEREDVVAVRKDFVHYFASNKENYFIYEKMRILMVGLR